MMKSNSTLIQIIASGALIALATQSSAENMAIGRIDDIRIQAGGVLYGQMAKHNTTSHPTVRVLQNGRMVAEVPLDSAGRFRATGLKGGAYELASGESRVVVRAWKPGTAPPNATNSITLDTDSRQSPTQSMMNIKRHYLPPRHPIRKDKNSAS